MFSPGTTPLACLAYILVGRLILAMRAGPVRDWSFALWNIGAFYNFFCYGQDRLHSYWLAALVAVVSIQYVSLRLISERSGWLPWIAFLVPILALVAVRYIPPRALLPISRSLRKVLERDPNFELAPFSTGISYLAFRASHLVLEVRNGLVPRPTFPQYIGFCFFAPTMAVGPINPYSNYHRGITGEAADELPVGRAGLRILVGLVKLWFLGAMLSTLSYSALLLDGHPHRWIDVPIAAVAYYLYLYCNFSGICDVAIGAAGLLGIPVAENFENPLAARNIKEFWNRWHITLSNYMRDVVFSPLAKGLTRLFGPANAIACAIVVVFLLIGVWHGAGWRFLAFGALHALGVVTNHYYTLWLKRLLGRDRFRAYDENRWIRAAAVAITFAYVTLTLALFAVDFPDIGRILEMLR